VVGVGDAVAVAEWGVGVTEGGRGTTEGGGEVAGVGMVVRVGIAEGVGVVVGVGEGGGRLGVVRRVVVGRAKNVREVGGMVGRGGRKVGRRSRRV
jgi:hypothetical protein